MAHRSLAAHIKKQWLAKHKTLQKRILREHRHVISWVHKGSKHMAVGSLTGILMLAHPVNASILSHHLLPPPPHEEDRKFGKDRLVAELKELLPESVENLSPDREIAIAHSLSTYFSFPVSPTLEGKRLNRTYGVIGAEQHLMRYPGDTMETHFESAEEQRYYSSGMAPGRGAWGYFTSSKEALTPEDRDREKYYIAVQTFLSPGWKENPNELYRFFKYRKMLVVNPENGKAVVAVIGDAGPSPSTGKHLGGSPEVMAHLERVDGGARGPVLYYFIHDPENRIPLGPIVTE